MKVKVIRPELSAATSVYEVLAIFRDALKQHYMVTDSLVFAEGVFNGIELVASIADSAGDVARYYLSAIAARSEKTMAEELESARIGIEQRNQELTRIDEELTLARQENAYYEQIYGLVKGFAQVIAAKRDIPGWQAVADQAVKFLRADDVHGQGAWIEGLGLHQAAASALAYQAQFPRRPIIATPESSEPSSGFTERQNISEKPD